MEGDSPSFLWLIQNGLSVPDMPELGGWGGRYSRVTRLGGINWYGDTVDAVSQPDGSRYSSIQSTVWRWRDAMQDDFAARMQWTLNESVSNLTHPPLVYVNGSAGPGILRYNLSADQSMVLDAGMTCDADHPQDLSQLDFEWFEQPQDLLPKGTGLLIRPLTSPLGTNDVLPLNYAGFPTVTLGTKVEISVQDGILLGREWHIVLQVRTRKGPYPIRRYKRIGMTVLD